jgi:hypothetical protein
MKTVNNYVECSLMNESEAKLPVEFVLKVLRQHEIEFDRLIRELEVLVLRVNELSDKIQRKVT